MSTASHPLEDPDKPAIEVAHDVADRTWTFFESESEGVELMSCWITVGPKGHISDVGEIR